MTIRIRCWTNVKGYTDARWPYAVLVRPKVGDNVRASCGSELKILSVTHGTQEYGPHIDAQGTRDLQPVIFLHLGKGKRPTGPK